MYISSIAFLVGAVVVLIPLFYVILRTRNEHAEHVFSLWYIYSLSLVIVSCLFAFIYFNTVNRGGSGVSKTVGEVTVFLFDAALDIRGEFYFVCGASAFL